MFAQFNLQYMVKYTLRASVMLCRQRWTWQFDFKIFNDLPHRCFSISYSLLPEKSEK